ncbi:MAG: hypothetical protein Q8869_01710, partial [Candidatus Phytoplasma australasiaticum]|nr:hypothetical protein [Candidatus Phytoplasma australasiaticum]
LMAVEDEQTTAEGNVEPTPRKVTDCLDLDDTNINQHYEQKLHQCISMFIYQQCIKTSEDAI